MQSKKRKFDGACSDGDNNSLNNKHKKQFEDQHNGTNGHDASKKPLMHSGTGDKWFDHVYNEVAEKKLNHADQPYLEMLSRAEKLLKRDVEMHEQSTRANKRSEEKWLADVVEKGTMGDRLSAIQLKFQQSPIHSLYYLEKLIILFEKKKMRDSINMFKCLKEIMIKDLLPPSRKLVAFDMRPLNELDSLSSRKRLYYKSTLNLVEALASIQVEGVAEQACIILADLLILRPEQEEFLLNALVNKIGHPKKKVDVTVTKQVERLLNKHPNMRLTVAQELERLIFRKNIIERTQFYAIHSLNRISLRNGDDELPLKLLRIYFSLFRILIVKEATSSRLLEMIVRGANNTFPYAKNRSAELKVEMDDFYKLVHTAPKLGTALNILSLLYQMQTYSSDLSDRFYSALYQRILRVQSGSSDSKFFYLMEQALRTDVVDMRVRAFIKRILQDKPDIIKLGNEKSRAALMTKLDGEGYTPDVRNPLFSHAEQSTDTELLLLSRHYHPSVSHFAKSIIKGKPILYKGNALVDFTLIRFLDRFAFKNPKEHFSQVKDKTLPAADKFI